MVNLAELLPEDFPNRDNLIERFPTAADLARSYQGAESEISASVRAPVESKDAKDWAAFYRKLGAPEEPDGYTVPSGDETFKSIVSALREPAQKAGLTTSQWDSLFGAASESMAERLGAVKDTQSEWAAAAKEKFGDEYGDKSALVDNAMADVIGDEAIVEALKTAGLNKNPAFMEAMIKVNEAQSDDTVPGGSGPGSTAPDFVGMAAKARELVKSGVLSDERHVDFEKSMGEFIAISQVLNENGFKGPDDEKLMPRWYPRA